MTPIFDDKGHFVGHEPNNEGCEHRTVGSRAWCHYCQEWCYPDAPCVRCEQSRQTEYARQLEDAVLALWREIPSLEWLQPNAPRLVKFCADLHVKVDHNEPRTNVWYEPGQPDA